jgi:hypothetical protein
MEELFSYCFSHNITPNELYVLYCIKNKFPVHDDVNLSLLKLRLKSLDYIDHFDQISIQGLKILNGYGKPVKKDNLEKTLGGDYRSMITEYNSLFPKIKLPSGKYAQTNEKTLEASFKWFFNNFSFSWEIIFKATEKYVNDFQLNGYKYMRTSQYFVRKQSTDKSYESELADYCRMIEEGEENSENHFKETVI